jgi:hypothetical protein
VRTKVTLVLLFLNVALFFFIFGFEREWRIKEQAQKARRPVLGPEAANIQAIEIAGPGTPEPVRLQKRTEGWMLVSPVEWPASQHAVNRILNELQFLQQDTSFSVAELTAAGQSLADYGLETPALTVTLTPGSPSGEAGATTPAPIALAIGAETSVGNRLYILSPDRSRVHVVQRSLADSLRVNLDQLRDPMCFTIRVFEARFLNLQQSAGPVNARVRLRRDGNRWIFEAPINARASKTATEIAINELNSLRASEFLGSVRSRPDLAGRVNTAAPSLRITLEGNNRRETLLLGQPVDPANGRVPEGEALYYAQMEDRDAIFTVALSTQFLNTLRNAQEDLRDPHVLPLEGREITAITLEAPNLPALTLQRLEPPAGRTEGRESWQIVRTDGAGPGPQTRPADPEVVNRLLEHLTLLSAEKFLRDVPSDAELESWGLKTRRERTITLRLAPEPGGPSTAPTELKLLLGVANEPEGRVYAKLDHQSYVYLVRPDILRATPVVSWRYRDRLLREMPAGARITGLQLTDLATGSVLYSRSLAEGESWDAAFASEPPDRKAALTELRKQLRTLRARSYVTDTFTERVFVQGESRPWAYRLDANLALTGAATEQQVVSTLFLGPRTGGSTQLVGSPEFDVVFEAEQQLLDALWVLIYGPRDPGPPAAQPPPQS